MVARDAVTPGVFLVGAGLSVEPPASVMSWWDFNNGVLEELKTRTLSVLRLNKTEKGIVGSLSLEELDILGFSQTVADVYSGQQRWLELLQILDGRAPNAGHLALASMMRDGRVACVLSTNFDSLIERALEEIGVEFEVKIPGRDRPPSVLFRETKPLLVKLHGSVTDSSSMVDLARQKAIGFDDEWRAWLTRTFETHPLTVVGFSGRDLDFSEDYLGLFRASEHIPSLTWLSLSGAPEVEVVGRLLSACGRRARIVRGSLPGFLVAQAPGVEAVTAPDRPAPRTIRDWFSNSLSHPLNSAMVICRLLRHAGRLGDARAMRGTLRTAIAAMPAEMPLLDASWMSLLLTMLGHESLPDEPLVAHADFLAATGIETAILETEVRLEFTDEEREMLDRAHASSISELMGGFALCAMHLGHRDHAADLLGQMKGLIAQIGLGDVARDRNNLVLETLGNLAAQRDDFRTSALAFRAAADGYRASGDLERLWFMMRNWAASIWHLGEVDLAKILSSEREAEWPSGTPLGVEQLISVAEVEWSEEDGRFDEVLRSVLLALAEDPSSSALAVDWLETLTRSVAPVTVENVLLAHSFLKHLGGTTILEITLPGRKSPERYTVVAPELDEALAKVGDDLIRLAADLGDRGGEAGEQAVAVFTAAATAFALADHHTDSIRALLLASEELALVKPERARVLVDLLLARATSALLPFALVAHVHVLVREGESANGLVDVEREIRRVRWDPRLGSDVAAAYVAVAHAEVLLTLERPADALLAADDAVALSAGSAFASHFEEARDTMRKVRAQQAQDEGPARRYRRTGPSHVAGTVSGFRT